MNRASEALVSNETNAFPEKYISRLKKHCHQQFFVLCFRSQQFFFYLNSGPARNLQDLIKTVILRCVRTRLWCDITSRLHASRVADVGGGIARPRIILSKTAGSARDNGFHVDGDRITPPAGSPVMTCVLYSPWPWEWRMPCITRYLHMYIKNCNIEAYLANCKS